MASEDLPSKVFTWQYISSTEDVCKWNTCYDSYDCICSNLNEFEIITYALQSYEIDAIKCFLQHPAVAAPSTQSSLDLQCTFPVQKGKIFLSLSHYNIKSTNENCCASVTLFPWRVPHTHRPLMHIKACVTGLLLSILTAFALSNMK
jgi:hypothetical protein